VVRAEDKYNEDELELQGSLETALRRVGAWCEMAASLRESEHESRGASTGEDTAYWEGLYE
jgi:muconolactone delta-isomerase